MVVGNNTNNNTVVRATLGSRADMMACRKTKTAKTPLKIATNRLKENVRIQMP